MATWRRLSLLRRPLFLSTLSPSQSPLIVTNSPNSMPFPQNQFQFKLMHCASLSTEESTSFAAIQTATPKPGRNISWKPMCLYNTQGKCTKIEDPLHLQKFSHSFSLEGVSDLNQSRAQEFDYFLVLDLEGKVEILEFPVLLFDAKTMNVLDVFHRFVRPTTMSEPRINEYIQGKYGNFGVDRVWHDTAIRFEEVIEQFEAWLDKHQLWTKEQGGHLNEAAFVTCGNWDLKTKIPQQCEVSRMKLQPYFMEWINLKDIYLNFYSKRAPGMLSMMRELRIPPLGSHHLGIDDSKNIARVLQRMLTDGALLHITARRSPNALGEVKFLFRNRVK